MMLVLEEVVSRRDTFEYERLGDKIGGGSIGMTSDKRMRSLYSYESNT